MSPYRAALLALVVVGTAFAAAVPAGAASDVDVARDALGGTHDGLAADGHIEDGDGQAEATPAQTAVGVAGERANVGQQTDENETENDSALGADISSFMQASLAETDGAVENGMWSAAFDGTDNQSVRERLVERRTSELREELAELRAEKQELMAEREAGNVSETAYKARISRLAGRIDALESSINATSSKARGVGANVEELSNLRSEARNLSGPAVSAVARNVSGVDDGQGPPDGVGNGPPDDAGNGNGAGDAGDGNGPGDAGNGTAGPPDDAGNDNSTPGQRGPPDDPGNAPFDDSGNEGEKPGEGSGAPGAGNGNGAPGEDDGNGPGAGDGDDAPGRSGSPGGNGTPGQDGAPGPGEAPGHDSAPGHNPNALASPTDVLDGSNLQAPADGFDVPVVSTVRLAPTPPW